MRSVKAAIRGTSRGKGEEAKVSRDVDKGRGDDTEIRGKREGEGRV